MSNAKFEARSARSALPMKLRWLEDFLVLAEQRTFARAAAVRRVTQPAFGRRIRALEEWLGARLFVRSAQGAVLTPAGKFLRAPAEEPTRDLYPLRQATLEVADREASTLSVAATHALSFVFFPDWIRSLATSIVRAATGLQGHRAGRQGCQERQNLAAAQRLAKDHRARAVSPMELKDVRGEPQSNGAPLV